MKHRKMSRKMMRLNKFIAGTGITSRRKAEEFILQGRITVNSRTITDLAFKVDPGKDEISLDGEKITVKETFILPFE